MVYKCLECGHIFEAGEETVWHETHGFTDGLYEEFSGCPICCGDYEETVACKLCDSEQLEDDLCDGVCEECLTDNITYELFLDYLTSSWLLPDFMFRTIYESDVPKNVSRKLMLTLREWYNRYTANDLLCNKSDFLDKCIHYVLDANGDIGKKEYVEWLLKRKGVE